MTIRKFFCVLYSAFFIFLIALGVISILLSLNQKGHYLGLIIVPLVMLSATVAVSLIFIQRKITQPIRMLQDSTHSVVTDLAHLTKVATDLVNGDLSQIAQIQTRPLELKTKDELGNLARDFNQMIAQLKEAGDACAKIGETVKFQIADVNMLVQATIQGKLSTRADASKHQGEFRKIVQGINDTLDAVIGPLRIAAEYFEHIGDEELPPKITASYHGEFNGIKNNINHMLDSFNETRRSDEASRQGRSDRCSEIPRRKRQNAQCVWTDAGQSTPAHQSDAGGDETTSTRPPVISPSATTEQAASVTEQAASVAETTTTVEEVRQTAEQSVERAQLVSEMASNTLKLAENGLDAAKRTEDRHLKPEGPSASYR